MHSNRLLRDQVQLDESNDGKNDSNGAGKEVQMQNLHRDVWLEIPVDGGGGARHLGKDVRDDDERKLASVFYHHRERGSQWEDPRGVDSEALVARVEDVRSLMMHGDAKGT